jgi:hypothetical protein
VSCLYSSGYSPDPHDTLHVLAFVLCPVRAFAPDGDAADLAAAAAVMGPAKAEVIRRWQRDRRARCTN